MKGQIDENAVTGGVDDPEFSDVGISNLIEQETNVLITVIGIGKEQAKTRAGGAFFKYLDLTSFDLAKYGLLKLLIETNINIIDYF